MQFEIVPMMAQPTKAMRFVVVTLVLKAIMFAGLMKLNHR